MLSIKVKKVIPLENMNLLVLFENNIVKLFDVRALIKDYPEFQALENPDIFNLVNVEAGGCGIYWNFELDCSEGGGLWSGHTNGYLL